MIPLDKPLGPQPDLAVSSLRPVSSAARQIALVTRAGQGACTTTEVTGRWVITRAAPRRLTWSQVGGEPETSAPRTVVGVTLTDAIVVRGG